MDTKDDALAGIRTTHNPKFGVSYIYMPGEPSGKKLKQIVHHHNTFRLVLDVAPNGKLVSIEIIQIG